MEHLSLPPGVPIPDLVTQINLAKAEYQKIYRRDYTIFLDHSVVQAREEANIIRKRPFCTINGDVRLNLTGLKGDLNKIIRENFDNPELYKVLECVINSIIFSYGNSNLVRRARIRHWIDKLQRIGGGVMGEVYAAGLQRELHRDIVLKIENTYEDSNLHELFVGIFGINRLRELGNLNFTYTYGGFTCSHPIKSPGKDVPVAWCDAESDLIYIVSEKVNGPTLQNNLAVCTPKQFLNYLVQVTLALSHAYKKINYTHYDLHSANVILRILAAPYQLEYDTPQGKMYLTVDKIATIIDYGYSTFKYDKKQYGSEEVITSGIFVNSYPMYDIFKFLIYGWLYSPPVLKRSIARYLQFFTTQRPEDIATNASIQGMVMWLPYIHPFSDMTYDTFWNFLWDNFRTEMDISITPTKVLGCNFRNCLPIGDILEQTVNKNQIPSDPFEYYDQINYLKTIPQGREWRKYVIEHYDYEIGFGVLYGQWLLEYSNFKGLQNMIIPNITGATEPEIANEHTINILINYLINVAKLVEIVNNLEVLRLVDQEMEKNSTLKVAIDWNSVTQAKDLLAKNIVNIKNTLPVIEKYLDNPEIEPLWKIIKWFKDIIS